MPTKCAITGTVVAPDGSPIPLAKVAFAPSDGRSAIGVRPLPPLSIAPEIAATDTDEEGRISIELFPGQYSVRVTRAPRAAFPTFQITVPDASAAVLSDIQNLTPSVPLNEAQLAVLAAQQARDAAVAAKVGIEEAEGRAAQSAADADGSAQAAGASAGAAAGSADAAGAAAGAAAGSAADAAADRTQTGQDRTAVAADRSEVETLRAAVATDRVQTGEDRGAAAASAAAALGSVNAAAGSAGDAAGSAAAAAASEEAAAQRASEAAADRVQTGQDRAAVAADRQQTGLDRVATGEDRAATGADRTQTGEDRTATAADRVGTGEDRAAAAGSAADALADRIAAEAAAIAAQTARDAALLAAVPIGTEILWRSNVPFPAGWSDTGIRLLSGTSERALLWNFSPLAFFSGAPAGVWFDPYDFATLFQNAAGSIPVTAAGQPDGLTLDKSKGLVLGPELVVNGGFDSTANWIIGAGWIIAGGVATCDASVAGAVIRQEVLSLGRTYKATYTITEISGGTANLLMGNGSAGVFRSAPGTYTEILTCSGDVGFRLQSRSAVVSFDNVSVRELPGHHATQPVAASRPTLARQPKDGRRNLLTASEDFASWTKQANASATASGVIAPDGYPTGSTFSFLSTANDSVYRGFSAAAFTAYVFSAYVKGPAGKTVRISLQPTGVGPVFVNSVLTGDWQRVEAAAVTGDSGNMNCVFDTDGINAASSVDVWGAQLENGGVASPYQKVVSQYDVTEVGVRDCWHLYTDPVDDGLIVTVPAGGWTNATIMVALETGITVLTGQTIPAGAWALPLPRPSKCFGLVAINRALSAMETALLTKYLNLKRGAE